MKQQINTNRTTFWSNISLWRLCIGIIMILLGMYVCFNPIASLVALALYIGIAFIIVGSGYVITSFSFESGWDLIVGLLDIFIGLILVANLGISAASLPIIFAIWSLAVGVIQIVGAIRLYRINMPWSWSLMIGICGIIFAFLILAYPMLGAITITAIIGIYMIIYGAFSLLEAFYFPAKQ